MPDLNLPYIGSPAGQPDNGASLEATKALEAGFRNELMVKTAVGGSIAVGVGVAMHELSWRLVDYAADMLFGKQEDAEPTTTNNDGEAAVP
jgi:hypothetical protein